MPANTQRFYGEQNLDLHPGNLHWPGVNGIPVVTADGKLPTTTTAKDVAKCAKTLTYHCRWFDLSDPQQMKLYQDIMERCVSRWYTLRYQSRHEQPEHDPPRVLVWLEWWQQYIMPSHNAGGVLDGRPNPR